MNTQTLWASVHHLHRALGKRKQKVDRAKQTEFLSTRDLDSLSRNVAASLQLLKTNSTWYNNHLFMVEPLLLLSLNVSMKLKELHSWLIFGDGNKFSSRSYKEMPKQVVFCKSQLLNGWCIHHSACLNVVSVLGLQTIFWRVQHVSQLGLCYFDKHERKNWKEKTMPWLTAVSISFLQIWIV